MVLYVSGKIWWFSYKIQIIGHARKDWEKHEILMLLFLLQTWSTGHPYLTKINGLSHRLGSHYIVCPSPPRYGHILHCQKDEKGGQLVIACECNSYKPDTLCTANGQGQQIISPPHSMHTSASSITLTWGQVQVLFSSFNCGGHSLKVKGGQFVWCNIFTPKLLSYSLPH